MIIENNLKYCPICLIHKEICICNIIEKISLKTRITLISYKKELMRITNTGRLVSLCLNNQKIIIKNDINNIYKPEDIISNDYTNLILYPEASQELNSEFIKKLSFPINLIVPDGTWRQTKKIFRSEKLLHTYKRVFLPQTNPADRFLRKPQKEYYFSTFDAISRALGIIENEEVSIKLKNVHDEMVKRLLKRNGRLTHTNL